MDERIDGYAAAMFEIANAEGRLDEVTDELYRFARALETSTELRDALVDPALPAVRKEGVIGDLLGGKASPLTTGLIGLVTAQGRASELPAIADRLAARAAAQRNRAVAEVRSAVPLDAAELDRLERALGKATGKQVEVKLIVDPTVLGGLVARVGDTVIDGTIRYRLESLRDTLQIQ